MKDKNYNKINLNNVKSFLSAHYSMFLNIFDLYPEHKKEQVAYRLSLCDDCIKEGECPYCGCPPEKKAFADKSCNKGDRFPDMLNKTEWEEFKKENNVQTL